MERDIVKLRMVSTSMVMTITKDVAEFCGLSEGDKVLTEVVGSGVVLVSKNTPHAEKLRDYIIAALRTFKP